MRTTLTIDDDLLRELRQKANRTGSPFKEIVNKDLKTGLKEMEKPKFFNFGEDVVSLVAPGEEIITTFPGNNFAAAYGTY